MTAPAIAALGAFALVFSAPGASAFAGATPLLAYIDPGSAGFIIVSTLAFLTAAGYTIRQYFAKVKRRVRRALGKVPDDPQEVEDPKPPHHADATDD